MPRLTPASVAAPPLSTPDALLKPAFPEGWFSRHGQGQRATGTPGACCAAGLCELCPVDAKFTIQNGMATITMIRASRCISTPKSSDRDAAGVTAPCTSAGTGASMPLPICLCWAPVRLFNPLILLRSGIRHRLLGDDCTNKCRSMSPSISTASRPIMAVPSSPAMAICFMKASNRRDHAACLIETWNSPFAYQRASLR